MLSVKYRFIGWTPLLLLLAVTGCGGPGGGGSPPATPATYSISGTIAGYSGSSLVLGNKSSTVSVNTGNSTFSFTGISNGSTYSISVITSPSGPAQTCAVVNGSGSINGNNITNVQVNCVTNSYTLSGSVSGLSGNGLVLQNNGADNLPVSTGNFTFGTPVANGSTYAVTVLAQPTGQTCTVTNGGGTMGTSNISNVQVNCVTNTVSGFEISGTISGLSGTGLVLQNNGGDNLAFSPNAAISTFTFNTRIANGNPYNVTVLTQPGGQTCSVTNSNGVAPVPIAKPISVSCTNIPTFNIGGTVSGLTGSGLVLQNNGGDNRSISSNGSFTFSTALVNSSPYSVTVFAQPSGQTCSVTNAGGTVSNANITNVQVNCVANTYSISGNVSGLTGTGLVLRNNGGDNRSISTNGGFAFSTAIASGNPYNVTVFTQPSGQTCSVTNGTGSVTSAPITGVLVNCVGNPTHTVGGTVSGLTGTGLVLRNNGSDDLPVNSGNFTFGIAIAEGNAYDVTILSQPSSQTCSVTNASGTLASTNITNVQVDCVTPAYTIGGTVSGLTGSGLVLQNNSGDNLSVNSSSFEFSTPISSGNPYNVTVLTQPSGQTCSVTNGSDASVTANVTNVQVACTDIPTYTIGGTISGLTGSGLVLQNNGGDNRSIDTNGSFTFSTAIANSNPYSVTVFTQPSGQTCSVTNAGGTVSNANITNVQVNCVTNTYSVSGSVSGLISSGTGLVLQNNNSDNRSIGANGTFTFNTAVASGNPYSVTILNQPVGQTCSVSNGSGTVTNAVIDNVLVNCTVNNYSVSGNVTGPLDGTALPGTLILQNNLGDNTVINAYGTFTFSLLVASGQPYSVTVLQQPSTSWSCVASGGVGVIGGTNVTDILVTCADSLTSSTGSFGTKRRSHTANLLDNGKVLIAGGYDSAPGAPLDSSALFDPAANSGVGAFTTTGNLGVARTSHKATLLADGKILITGGQNGSGNLDSAEIFDRTANAGAGAFAATTGSMSTVRTNHSAVLLADDTVLITGGYGGAGSPVATAEIYNPATGIFSGTTGSMSSVRNLHTSTRLNDGKVKTCKRPRFMILLRKHSALPAIC